MTNKTPAQILEALAKPFPKNAIKKRQGGGGKMYDYVETHAVIHRLNAATNGDWSFVIRNYEWRGDLLMVHGELTIPGLGTRSAFGVQQVKGNAGEDLVKGGASDALKKAATLFGVALDLYGEDYESAPVTRQDAPQRAKAANGTTDTPAPAENTEDPSKDPRYAALGRTLHGLFDHDFLHAVAVKWEHESFADIPANDREKILGYANGRGDAGLLAGFQTFQARWEQENQRPARKPAKTEQSELVPDEKTVPNPMFA